MNPLRARVRLLAVALLVTADPVLGCRAVAQAQIPKETPAMDQPPSASRGRAPRVLPVEHAGVRYMQDTQARRFGGDQSGGYVVAVDPASGQRLWMLKVYRVADHSAAGVDDIGVHFRSMALVPGEDQLEIVNEVGGVYRVDLRARSSRHVSGPDLKP